MPALQKRFLKRAARRRGHPLEMTPAALRRLEGHSFYGNITVGPYCLYKLVNRRQGDQRPAWCRLVLMLASQHREQSFFKLWDSGSR